MFLVLDIQGEGREAPFLLCINKVFSWILHDFLDHETRKTEISNQIIRKY